MNRIFLMAIAAGIFIPQVASAAVLTPYEVLRDRLLAGTPTVSIVDLSQCKLISGSAPAPSAKGGFIIHSFMILSEPKSTIAYSDEHFTVTTDGIPVAELLQYRVRPDNTAIAKFSRLSPTTFKPLSEPMTYECVLGTGIHYAP
ncbi:VirK family protein [Brucella pituitosa]|uniref:VirK family protein n=1 Tax=Brucella pituitosa TaxID=571256 RepID=UPI0009A17DA4|nr:VirK family protein [Brucella pituitosa]